MHKPGQRTVRLAALLLGIALAVPGAAGAQDSISGGIRVRAPGVVHVGAYWVHLLGVRGPGTHGATQYRQEGYAEDLCKVNGLPFQCGLISQGTLARLSTGIYYRCDLQHFPGDPRHWGICRPYDPIANEFVEGAPSLNREWVLSGWAEADLTYTDAFAADEAEARRSGLGMWAADVASPAGSAEPPVRASGPAAVIDSRTLRVGGADFRLFGIDAPELFQGCSYRGVDQSHGYSCGLQARAALIRMSMGKQVFCAREESANGAQDLAWCWEANDAGDGPGEGAASFNEMMLAMGWALADLTAGERFRQLELEASRNNMGMHTGGRVRPVDWRRGQR